MNYKGTVYLAAFAACLFSLPSSESSAQLFSVTPHDLLPEQRIVIEDEEIPQWKVLWDEARKSGLQGDFETAQRKYRALLILKSNLEEARWELARLEMYLKHWDDAAEHLELLIESEADSMRYVNALGKVMWEVGQYERAVQLFKRVYEKNPADQTALAGLVEGLNKLGRKNEALPYLEELVRREPTNRGLRRYLAFLLFEAEKYEKAGEHLTILSRNDDVEFEVLHKTARTYEILERVQQAAIYWERVLARRPENLEAHRFLAGHYEKRAQPDRSLAHLQALARLRPDDATIYARLGEIHEKAGRYDRALTYYDTYLRENPADPEIFRRVSDIESIAESREEPRAALRQDAAVEQKDQSERLLQTIGALTAAGRFGEAVPLYRELLRTSPADPGVRKVLADDVIAVGENEGRGAMLAFLADVAQDDAAMYKDVAERLRSMERREEMLAILHEIHERDPGDTFTTRELAIQYLQRDELQQSSRYFAELSEADCLNIRCLEARASLAGHLDMPAQQLRDYEALLELQRERYDIRLEAVSLAAHMGLLDSALFHAGYLQFAPPDKDSLELKIHLAEAYRESGYLSRALERYREVLEQNTDRPAADSEDFRLRAWLGMAEAYQKSDLMYEAEQVLRKALVREENSPPILEALFFLYIETGRSAESEIWLQAMNRASENEGRENPGQRLPDWKLEFLRAEMHREAGEYPLAIERYKLAAELLPREGTGQAPPDAASVPEPELRIARQMAQSFLQAREYARAEHIVLGLRNRAGRLEHFVLLEQIYRAWGKDASAAEMSEKALDHAREDFGRMLKLADLYAKHGDIPQQFEIAQLAAAREPESLIPKHLLIEARMQRGEYRAALELADRFLRSYPENTRFLARQAELLARTGNLQQALDVAEMILVESPGRRDIILLQGRILWEMNRWRDSVSRYESVMQPPVEDMLEEELRQLSLTVDQSPARSSWWETLTFSEGTPLNISQVIMAPQHTVDFSEGGQAANSVAAAHYALYRWQERFGGELSVRRSVMRREYYHAAHKLEKVIAEHGANDFLLYDLAGLYSKLERLGDEAAIYGRIAEQNPHFPGLSEAVQRNDLKRRPQVFLAYTMQEDDGRQGYKAVRRETAGSGARYYRPAGQEWNLDIARINYESTRDAQAVRSWRTLLTYDARLSQSLELSLGGGFEKLQSPYDDTFLWQGAITGKIADEMRAVFSVEQDIVSDTIASLKRNIKRRDYKLEFLFDLFPNLLLGGYYDFIYYSDSNRTDNYTFWASYILLPEPSLLKISYNYDFYDSHEGSIPGVASDDGFAPEDHPYWAPVNYWITRFSFYFKHQMSNDALARGVPSYYTIEYSLGYDSDDNDLHELKGSLNLEIARNYTLSASYGYVDLDVFRHKEALLSLMYRF